MERRKLHTQEEVEKLLEKFMAGTTTLEEEAQLADFFRTHEVTGKLAIDKKMFALFDEGKVIVEEEKKSKVWWKYVSIAAIILLLLGLGFWLNGIFNKKPELVAQTDTIKTAPQVEEKSMKEQPQEKKENVEKADTINKVKEIQRFSRPPITYMAKVEKQEVQQKKDERPDTIVFTEPPYIIFSPKVPTEDYLGERFMEREEAIAYDDYSIEPIHQHRSSTAYEDVERDIQIRGERMTQAIELAMSDDLY